MQSTFSKILALLLNSKRDRISGTSLRVSNYIHDIFYAIPDTNSKTSTDGLKTNPIKTEHLTENQWQLHLFWKKEKKSQKEKPRAP